MFWHRVKKSFPFPLRITIPLMLFTIVISLGLYHLHSEVRHVNTTYEEKIRHRVLLEGAQLSGMVMRLYNFANIQEVENMLIQGQNMFGYRVALLYDGTDTIIGSSDDALKGIGLLTSPAAEIADIFQKARDFSSSYYRFSDDRMLFKSVFPVPFMGLSGNMQDHQSGVLYLEYDLSQGKKLAHMGALQKFYNLMIVLSVTCFVVWGFFVFTLTRRANRLVVAGRRFADGDTEVRVDLNGSDEFAFLGNAFNQMVKAVNASTNALKESEERNRRLVEGLQEHFLYSRNTDGQFTYASPTITRILGYSQKEFKEHFTEYLTDNPLNIDIIQRNELGIKGEPIPSYEIEALHKDGRRRWLHVSERPVFGDEGSVIAIEGIAHDITDKKRAVVELRKAKEKAEEATKLKDKFVSLVAHDLRSPFASILGFLQLMDKETDPPLHPKQRGMLNIVVESSKNLVKMIDNLLDTNSLQTGNMVIKPSQVNVYHLAHSAIDALQYLADEKGVTVSNEIPKMTLRFVDEKLFREVMQNLVSNAIKFCKAGDRITIFIPDGKNGAIAVKDTGIGIEKNILPHIFRHDVKTSTRGTSGETGTGLGLPFCHDIMKAHGASLTVESTLGKGSIFYIGMPPCGENREITTSEQVKVLQNKRSIE